MAAKKDPELKNRILDFFNTVSDPQIICSTILDDPLMGKSVPHGILPATAENIIKGRNKRPGKKFTTLKQIEKVKGVGLISLHNIICTFLVKSSIPVSFPVEVTFENTAVVYFESVQGFESQSAVLYKAEIGTESTPKNPGTVEYKNIILQNGHAPVKQIWDWRKRIEAGVADKRNGIVRILSRKGTVFARFRLLNAWPSRIRCCYDTVVIEQRILIEELELTVEKWAPA